MLGADFPVWLLWIHTPVSNPHSGSTSKPNKLTGSPEVKWGKGTRNDGLSLGP